MGRGMLQEAHNLVSPGLTLSAHYCQRFVCVDWETSGGKEERNLGVKMKRWDRKVLWTLLLYIIKLEHQHKKKKRIRPDQWFSAGEVRPLLGTSGNVWRHFCRHGWRRWGRCPWHRVGRNQNAKHPKISRTAPSTRSYSAPNVSITSEVLSHLSGQLSLNRQEITSVGEGVGKREPSCTVGGNVNWCSHCGKQKGSSLRN